VSKSATLLGFSSSAVSHVWRMVHHPKDIQPTWHNCGKHWSIRYTHLVLGRIPLCLQNSLNSSGHGNIAQSVLRDLTCARKTFPTPLHHFHQPVPLTPAQNGATDSCCLRQILIPVPVASAWCYRNKDSSD
jgi:hypothetical protein